MKKKQAGTNETKIFFFFLHLLPVQLGPHKQALTPRSEDCVRVESAHVAISSGGAGMGGWGVGTLPLSPHLSGSNEMSRVNCDAARRFTLSPQAAYLSPQMRKTAFSRGPPRTHTRTHAQTHTEKGRKSRTHIN